MPHGVVTVEAHYLSERVPICFLHGVIAFFADFRPNLRGGNSYHSSFDDPLGKGAALKADITTCWAPSTMVLTDNNMNQLGLGHLWPGNSPRVIQQSRPPVPVTLHTSPSPARIMVPSCYTEISMHGGLSLGIAIQHGEVLRQKDHPRTAVGHSSKKPICNSIKSHTNYFMCIKSHTNYFMCQFQSKSNIDKVKGKSNKKLLKNHPKLV